MDAVLEYLAARMREPSTYVSLGTMLAGVGVVIKPEYWQAIMGISMGLGGLLGTLLTERKKTTPQEIKQMAAEVVTDQVKPTALQ